MSGDLRGDFLVESEHRDCRPVGRISREDAQQVKGEYSVSDLRFFSRDLPVVTRRDDNSSFAELQLIEVDCVPPELLTPP
jgi:hypothetical protein